MFKKYQLKNGLKVLLVESHKSPVLSIQMWVRTGSADEKKSEAGISHFIEHLVFKGTRKFKVGEIASTVEAAGGELNAYTSFDQTVFYVTISKEFESVGLDVISEMMGYPQFDETEINNEREVVIEEIKRSHDSPHRQASRQLFSMMYKKHPYGTPVIGFEENIKTVSRKTILNYFQTRYNPKTMTLVVAGDFNGADMRKKIEQYFASYKVKKLRKIVRPFDKTPVKGKVAVKTAPFEETIVHVAFPTPKASHKDIAALEVFALIFGQGESSRLNRRLRMSSHLVNFAGSSVFVARDPGFMALSLSLNAKDFNRAMPELLDEMRHILADPVSEDELKKAITNMLSEQYYSLETVDGLARKYGHYQDLFGDPSYFEGFMHQVQKLTAQDILKVARKYMNPKLASVIIMSPSPQNELQTTVEKWLNDWRKMPRHKSTEPLKVEKIPRSSQVVWETKKPKVARLNTTGGTDRIVLENGIKLIVRPDFDTPVISVRCASLGGSRLENPRNQGVTELLSRVWTSGAGQMDELQMNAKMDEMAASLSAFAGRNSAGLSMTCLRPFATPMLEMLFATLCEPKFQITSIQREIKSMQEHVKLRKDNPAQLCILAFMKSMFGDHPYGRDPYGEESTIGGLSQQLVQDIFKQQSGLTLVASGAIDPKEFRAQVEQALSKLRPGVGKNQLFPIQFPKNEIKIFQESIKQQSHIVMGYPGLKLNSPERYTLQVIQAILAGQGGRLFLELRDKASLAYSVSPLRMEGLEGGYFGAYIGCSPEKSGTAIQMMRIEFEKLMSKDVGPEEVARAQRYLIGKHDIELQKNSNITSAILFDEIYGIDYLETYHFSERIRAVTSRQIRRLAETIFAQPAIISLVGPEAPWMSQKKGTKVEMASA